MQVTAVQRPLLTHIVIAGDRARTQHLPPISKLVVIVLFVQAYPYLYPLCKDQVLLGNTRSVFVGAGYLNIDSGQVNTVGCPE